MSKSRAQIAFEIRHPETKDNWEHLTEPRKQDWDRVADFDAGIIRYEDLSKEHRGLAEWATPPRVSLTLPCKSCGGTGVQPTMGIGGAGFATCPDCGGEGFGSRSRPMTLTIADFKRLLGLSE